MSALDRALADRPEATRIVAWTDRPSAHEVTVERLIHAHAGQQPRRATQKCRTVLLTSGTTGTPKGAKLTGGDAFALTSILDRTPWRAEETVVIAAPMFHAWGFSQLIFAASMACTVVTRRKFDPEATLELVDRHRATGLALVPVMFDRIMDLPDNVRRRYSGRSLRLAAFVVLTPGASATVDTLKLHVRDNLANYKVPREIIVLDELPRSSTGKILRNDLKARVGG